VVAKVDRITRSLSFLTASWAAGIRDLPKIKGPTAPLMPASL